jgi:hypothetical protein
VLDIDRDQVNMKLCTDVNTRIWNSLAVKQEVCRAISFRLPNHSRNPVGQVVWSTRHATILIDFASLYSRQWLKQRCTILPLKSKAPKHIVLTKSIRALILRHWTYSKHKAVNSGVRSNSIRSRQPTIRQAWKTKGCGYEQAEFVFKFNKPRGVRHRWGDATTLVLFRIALGFFSSLVPWPSDSQSYNSLRCD